MEERGSAIKYYEKALAKDPQNAEIFTGLLLNLLNRYEYRRAFGLIDHFATSDSLRVIIWNKIGEYFLVEGRRRDARDAFRNVLLFAKQITGPSTEVRSHAANAESRLNFLQ
jgi:tetratricopeptide (TPR) repeat protein